MQTIHVDLGPRSYPIYLGSQTLSSIGPICKQHPLSSTIVILTDRTVAKFYLSYVANSLNHHGFSVLDVVIPTGEQQKSISRANKIFTELIQHKVGRNATILALGGGVIGDLAGFVAAVYLRGIGFVQVPTTLLAQVDSSVGGKVAVNHPLGKNMIGAFYQPKFVFSDVMVLKTLPLREIVCGLGEAIKYGIIADEALFGYIENHLTDILSLEPENLTRIISRCCTIKSEIVSQDETERSVRTILNFGHTIGHALEAAGRYRVLKHGEGVLLGMLAETKIAAERGHCSRELFERLQELLCRVPLQVRLEQLRKVDIVQAVAVDKKTINGRVRIVMPLKLGKVQVIEGIERSEVVEAIEYIKRFRWSQKKHLS